MDIKANLDRIKSSFENPNCLLIAVSKTKPESDIQAAYEAGIRDFGENKVQELTDKAPKLPQDIRWHMIGHLQRNKVKYIAPFVHLIHGVDSLRLLKQINKEGKKIDRVIPCLLQIHIAEEDSKFGLDEKELKEILLGEELKSMNFIAIKGLMGMATFTEDNERIRREFISLRKLRDAYASSSLPPNTELKELSMGMSADYKIAIEEGSSMVRIGSAIFGERNYG
ncbi:YggS family pyridoxal phosphate-dependent enzyme [Pleomorphovibrio marinus]|uniref:YggS family pyridoxal phosphate-dependent enzyme n=1 Tax=Pleomorphovibrio marinus TaxID=2164132 RepID=UPI000E0C34A8|nr:YggS family pyridoxal phosphate-dependent enzyme [Pleomorphovibrio marinus]